MAPALTSAKTQSFEWVWQQHRPCWQEAASEKAGRWADFVFTTKQWCWSSRFSPGFHKQMKQHLKHQWSCLQLPEGSTAVASKALWKQLFPPRNSGDLNLSFKAAAPFLTYRASLVHSFSFLLVNSTVFPNTSETLCHSLPFSLQNPPGLCLSSSQQPLPHSACYHWPKVSLPLCSLWTLLKTVTTFLCWTYFSKPVWKALITTNIPSSKYLAHKNTFSNI